jgi:hypothetical protein
MQQTNSKIGGVLSIVAGSFGIMGMLFFLFIGLMFLFFPGEYDGTYRYDTWSTGGGEIFVAVWFFILGIFSLLTGALAIVGGIFGLRRRHWGLALAGSIASAFTFFPCGVPAIIFTALGKPEFGANAPPAAPAAPMQKIVG